MSGHIPRVCYISMYIHTYRDTHIHNHAYIFIMHTYSYIQRIIHKYMNDVPGPALYIYTHNRTYIHLYIHPCTHIHKYMNDVPGPAIHTYIRIYIRIYIHTHAYVHTHTHIHTCLGQAGHKHFVMQWAVLYGVFANIFHYYTGIWYYFFMDTSKPVCIAGYPGSERERERERARESERARERERAREKGGGEREREKERRESSV